MTYAHEASPSGLLSRAEGSELQQRLNQAGDRARYLARVARGLSGAMHTERAVDLVLEMLVGPVVDWAQVAMADRRTWTFRARQVGHATRSAALPVHDVDETTTLGRAIATGSTDLLLVPDGGDAESAALASVVPADGIREELTGIRPMDLLTIPLSARGTTYGALSIALRGGTGFDDQAVAFLEDFAHRVSVTLDTTRALAETRRVAAVLSRDLNPPLLPRMGVVDFATYYRVAFEQEALGGDFYDVHGSADDWTAVVGDVCGKGVEAAVLTGKVRQAVRTAAIVDRDPAAVLALTNRVLLLDSGGETFVTAVCARGRREGDVLHLDVAAAGHPQPLVVRLDGSVETVSARGPVLGLLDETSYTPVRVDLCVGETCLFYTDGVPEAPGHRGRFGDDGMTRVLRETGPGPAKAQVEAVAVALTAHLRERAHDDIAILAVQPVDPPATVPAEVPTEVPTGAP
ncbi:MAG: SpoIIE family protein phosphatase [Nocardioidaceae bacterium]|nr:SpoIIE family protein phosphatase [Nocardioidaceae bacterium]